MKSGYHQHFDAMQATGPMRAYTPPLVALARAFARAFKPVGLAYADVARAFDRIGRSLEKNQEEN